MNPQTNSLAIDYVNPTTCMQISLPIDAFRKPRSLAEYEHLQQILDQLIDDVRDDETHPLESAMQIIGENLEEYDDRHHPSIGAEVSPVDLLKHLMAEYSLHQKDLASIFGGQANVSKFLNGERNLSKSNILGLKEKFGLSADFFIK